jgi:hypothetical protein
MGQDFGSYTAASLQAENASTLVGGFRMAADNSFVDRDYADDGANQFDDILVWLSASTLNSRLIAAGRLP